MKEIIRSIRTFPERWLIFFIAPIVYFRTDIVTFIDPTGMPMHEDVWENIFMAIIITMIYSFFSYSAIKFNQPSIFKWYEQNFDQPSPNAAWLFFAYLALHLLAMAIILAAIV